jgi:hypothetical protein
VNLVQRVCLIDATGHISDDVLGAVAGAVNCQVQGEFQKFWGIKAEITTLPHAGGLRPGDWPVFIVRKTQDGSAGFHRFSHGQPYAEVAEGEGGHTWSIAASHETLEMLVDPSGNRLVPGRGIELHHGEVRDTNEIVGYLLEICDPSEDQSLAYPKQIAVHNGQKEDVFVSDFYTPHFFGNERRTDVDVPYSYQGKITEPRRVCQGGYLTWWDPQTRGLRQLDHTGDRPRMNYLPPNQTRMSLREQSDQHMRGRAKLVRK